MFFTVAHCLRDWKTTTMYTFVLTTTGGLWISISYRILFLNLINNSKEPSTNCPSLHIHGWSMMIHQLIYPNFTCMDIDCIVGFGSYRTGHRSNMILSFDTTFLKRNTPKRHTQIQGQKVWEVFFWQKVQTILPLSLAGSSICTVSVDITRASYYRVVDSLHIFRIRCDDYPIITITVRLGFKFRQLLT